jgi:hypothetical protein
MEKIDQDLYNDLYRTTMTLLTRGTETDMLEKHLLQKTDDLVLITVVIKEARNEYYATLRKEGFRIIGIGAIFIACGFLITILNFDSNRSFTFAMIGFTSVGACIVFFGLYKVIG